MRTERKANGLIRRESHSSVRGPSQLSLLMKLVTILEHFDCIMMTSSMAESHFPMPSSRNVIERQLKCWPPNLYCLYRCIVSPPLRNVAIQLFLVRNRSIFFVYFMGDFLDWISVITVVFQNRTTHCQITGRNLTVEVSRDLSRPDSFISFFFLFIYQRLIRRKYKIRKNSGNISRFTCSFPTMRMI